MKLQPGSVIVEIEKTPDYPRRYRILSVAQTTRCQTSYFCRSESEELKDLTVLLTICNYNPRLLGKQQYVDNLRARLEHQGEMLTTPENALPEPVDFFRIANPEDDFQFVGAEKYKQTEPVLVTERYYGVPLDKLINDKGKLEERRALVIALGLSKLLSGFHKKGVLVYELNPEDLVIDETDCDRPWLLSAANHQRMKSNGKVAIGDLVVPLTDFAFTAPEVERGRDSLDARSDIYSFGALLLYMLTAKRPKEVIREGVSPIAAIYSLPDLTPETIRLLYRCLAPDPAARFQDCAAMEEAIVEAEALSQVAPPPAPQAVGAKRESQRLALRWTLPLGLSHESSLCVRRYVERQEGPPDPLTWDVLASDLAYTTTTYTDESPIEGARLHYAVFVQETGERGPRLSRPCLVCEAVPKRSTAREFFTGLVLSPALVLWGTFCLLKPGKVKPKPEPKPEPKPQRTGVLSTLEAHRYWVLLALVLIPMLVVIFARSPRPWMTAAISCGAPLCFLLHTLEKATGSSQIWFQLSIALTLGMALLLVQWTLRLACSPSASRVGGLIFLIAVGALGLGPKGPHPLLFTLVPLLASFALLGAFFKERLSWQLALAGGFTGIAVVLDPGALGVAAAYVFFLVWLSKHGGSVDSRMLGVFVGGFLLGVFLVGLLLAPISWPLHYASAWASSFHSVGSDPTLPDWKTLVAVVSFLLFWALSARFAQPKGKVDSRWKDWPTLVNIALLGAAGGALVRPRQGLGDLLVLVPFTVFFATPAIARAAKDLDLRRLSIWSACAIALSLAPLSLQATSAVQSHSQAIETTMAKKALLSLNRAVARYAEPSVVQSAPTADGGIKKPVAGKAKKSTAGKAKKAAASGAKSKNTPWKRAGQSKPKKK